ncbi:MAG: hypothetical protein J2P36_24410, partial [Ktedonobacteraceae bacterium]|nr:hypothetical protein [Ktedonobacteraceae bacterium]
SNKQQESMNMEIDREIPFWKWSRSIAVNFALSSLVGRADEKVPLSESCRGSKEPGICEQLLEVLRCRENPLHTMKHGETMNALLMHIMTSATFAIIGAGLLSVWWHFMLFWRFLGSSRARAWRARHVWSMRGLFWLVNGVCMLFSAQNAGYLFGIYEPLTGWAVGLVLDLLIIVFTQSMLHALARGEKGRAAQILGFIFACTLISFLGNLAHNLHVSTSDAFTGVWLVTLLPYAASVMPFFLVALAWVSDLKGNPLETMDVQEYAALEQKQADFLRIQVEQREQRAALQTRLIAVEQMELRNKRLRKRKLPKTFRWFWEQPADLVLQL